MTQTCSCCRAEVEIGCDLCRYCREDYERRQWECEQEEHDAALDALEQMWLSEQ